MQFTHLHVHSHFSILDGMSKIPDLIKKCKKNGMYAMALTDHGNMYGIKEFFDTVNKENKKVKEAIKEQQAILDNDGASQEEKMAAQAKIEELNGTFFKPILGTEAYCAHQHRTIRDERGWHLILLAKNKKGYLNLCKISSKAFIEGYYYQPRMDHELLEQYHEGIICCSACLGGEIPQKIMHGDLSGAEESVLWFKNLFGDDYYLELQRHQTDKPNAAYDTFEKQEQVNKVLIELARKHNIKLIATNDVHFVEEEHGEAHDRLICLSTGKDFNDPNRLHYTKQEWLKSPAEMEAVFSDIPEALANTQEIVDKVETYSIDSAPIMPVFPIPESFGSEDEYRSRITEKELFDEFTQNEHGEVVLSKEAADKVIVRLGGYEKLYRIKFEADYLADLTWKGAHKRYGEELSDEQIERIKFELHVIKTMGFPGYFLIVQDYIRGAREELGVSVGPGRGSAAGSVVAYCLWITDIDPLKYDLLFERFLNPDRISLPDIDVDFDDAGRGRVLDWITEKYGVEKVAHIITYGTMATKSSIADVARVQGVPIPKVNEIKSYIPERSFPDNIKDEKGKSPKVNLHNCYKYVPELKSLYEEGPEDIKSVLTYAEELEDTNRQIGIHACGVIIGADDLTNFAPVCTIYDKESKRDVVVTQYDGHVIETVGLIKMDFLGLKNLTIIKDALESIKKRHGVEIDIDHIPIDDELTYKLFCDGNTVGTFQFESAGMQKYLRELQPHVFEDLIAMNALYRPGPMDYIPTFINRKLGREPIEYPIPEMEKYLKDTYGVTVYQEQVMLLSRQLANFTRGESDTLRKAMGKKLIDKMMELKDKFLKQGQENGHPADVLEHIWKDWEKFASYAFNKSHATCYSWVAYQTAYLKAHYPAEYMAAVMTSALSDSKRVIELMEECRRMKLTILGPSINESEINFSVNSKGEIRFGLGAIAGMGQAASSVIINERNANGVFKSVFDLLERVDIKSLNRKNMEVLAKAGAFDEFSEMHRAQFFYRENENEGTPTYIEKLIKWAVRKQESANSNQMSLFDLSEEIQQDDHPPIPQCPAWNSIEQCGFEKEVIGFYLNGHPLDAFRLAIDNYVHTEVAQLNDLTNFVGQSNINFCGVIKSAKSSITRRGSSMGIYTIEDYSGTFEFRLFDDSNVKFQPFLQENQFVYCTATVEKRNYRQPDGSWKEGSPQFRIVDVSLLASVVDTKTKRIVFHVPLASVTHDLATQIQQQAKKHRGNALLQAVVEDDENKMQISMSAPGLRVKPDDFIPLLRSFTAVSKIELSDKEK